MEMEFEVRVRAKDLFDYQLHHTYTSASGLLGALLGIFVMGVFTYNQEVIYLLLGAFMLCYTPIVLFFRSLSQAASPSFQTPMKYHMTDEGVTISIGEQSQMIPWDAFYRAVSTRKNVVLYTSKVNAFLFPRTELQERMSILIEMISTHMPADKVRIRGAI